MKMHTVSKVFLTLFFACVGMVFLFMYVIPQFEIIRLTFLNSNLSNPTKLVGQVLTLCFYLMPVAFAFLVCAIEATKK